MADGWPDDPQLVKPNENVRVSLCAIIQACTYKMGKRFYACPRMHTSICTCKHGRVCELSPTFHGRSEGSWLPFTSAVAPPALVFRRLIRPP